MRRITICSSWDNVKRQKDEFTILHINNRDILYWSQRNEGIPCLVTHTNQCTTQWKNLTKQEYKSSRRRSLVTRDSSFCSYFPVLLPIQIHDSSYMISYIQYTIHKCMYGLVQVKLFVKHEQIHKENKSLRTLFYLIWQLWLKKSVLSMPTCALSSASCFLFMDMSYLCSKNLWSCKQV